MTFDLLVRGGTVYDGTGAEGVPADVGVVGDRITAVGDLEGERARRTVEAEGRVVTPGFVDLHTHLDAQVWWDGAMSSSCYHGVTSTVIGNCGVTFAPVRDDDRAAIAGIVESVEDIPAASLEAGLPWEWNLYSEFLDALDRRSIGVNTAGLVGHGAVRYWAMGDRSLDEGAAPSADELRVMAELVEDAMGAGAYGLSLSRTLRHRAPDRRFMPGTWADEAELRALGGPLRSRPGALLTCAPRFDADFGDASQLVVSELGWMRRLAAECGVRVTFNITTSPEQGRHYEVAVAQVAEAAGEGLDVRLQTTTTGIAVLSGLAAGTPFDGTEPWRALRTLSLAERLDVLRRPERRIELIDAAADIDCGHLVVLHPDEGFCRGLRRGITLPQEADRRGVSAAEAFIDLNLETEGRVLVRWALLNADEAKTAELLASPRSLLGLGDAGAHVGQIMDAGQPTSFLVNWVRDTGRLDLADGIRRLTSEPARFVGLDRRGVIEEGAYADLNVIDLEALWAPVPEYRYDLPGGAGRYVQTAEGYDATIVNGAVTFDHGEPTGELPGRVLRRKG